MEKKKEGRGLGVAGVLSGVSGSLYILFYLLLSFSGGGKGKATVFWQWRMTGALSISAIL